MHCKCKDRPTFGALSKQGLCLLCSAANTTKNLSENKFRKKNQIFWFMEKHLSYNFHLWKNVYHRDFVQRSVRMELYDKKFLIYGNCMIRSFGHPGNMPDFGGNGSNVHFLSGRGRNTSPRPRPGMSGRDTSVSC